MRETFEETGLRLRHPDVLPCGYERFTPKTDDNVFGRDKPFLQVFRTRLDDVRPELTDGDDGIHETRWVDAAGVRRSCAATSSGGPSRSRSSPTCAISPARSERTYAAHRGGRHTWLLSWWVRFVIAQADANSGLSAGS